MYLLFKKFSANLSALPNQVMHGQFLDQGHFYHRVKSGFKNIQYSAIYEFLKKIVKILFAQYPYKNERPYPKSHFFTFYFPITVTWVRKTRRK